MMVNDTEWRIKDIEALNRDLGAVLAVRFLSLLHREPADSVGISRRLTPTRAFMRFSIGWRSGGWDGAVVNLRRFANMLTVLLPRTI
jgi:hypothetical protein